MTWIKKDEDRINCSGYDRPVNFHLDNYGTNRVAALKRIFKNTNKIRVWQDEKQGEYICNNYQLIYLNTPLKLFEYGERWEDMETIWDCCNGEGTDILHIPSLSQLEVKIAKAKAEKKPCIIDLTNSKNEFEKFYVNGQYLLDMMQVFPNAQMKFIKDAFLSLMYFKHKDGKAVLLAKRNKTALL